MFVSFVFALTIATQDAPAAPTEPRSHNVLLERVDNAPATRASEACAFEESSTGWVCNPVLLSRWQMQVREEAEAPDGIEVLGGHYPKEADKHDGCFASGVVIVLVPATDIVVDWDTAALVVDGRAVPAVPGFARQVTSGLSQRKVRVPQGTRYSEALFPVMSDVCVFPSPEPNVATTTSAQLQVLRNGQSEALKLSVTRAWTSTTEKAAFALLEEPFLSKPPEVKPVRPLPAQNVLVGAGVCGGIGAVIGGALGVAVRLSPSSQSSSGLPGYGTMGAMFGAVHALLGAAAGGLIGYYGFSPAEYEYLAQIRYWTWREKRRALGLESAIPAGPPSTTASSDP